MRWKIAIPLALAACSGAQPGQVVTADRDGDGWTPAAGDCDDRSDQIYPGAPDPPRDGVDQDCDGADDPTLEGPALMPGEVVITEIHRDPIGIAADLAEWFEVHNASGVPIDLVGLQIRDDGGELFRISLPLPIDVDGYAVIGAWADPEDNGGAPVDLAWGGEISLSNTQDQLILEVPGGLIIDEVRWDARFPNADGQAMSLDPTLATAVDNDQPESWCLTPVSLVYGLAGYGTPGEANPPCDLDVGKPLQDVPVGGLVITEILQNPAAGDPDAGEWIEVLNPTADAIELHGLVLSDADGGSAEVQIFRALEPGGYVVFGASDDESVNGGVSVDWSWEQAFGLSNGEDSIQLSFGTRIFDVVAWDNGLTFPDPDGASMSLDASVTDAAANDDGSNWCEGLNFFGDGDLGSPGLANPGCP